MFSSCYAHEIVLVGLIIAFVQLTNASVGNNEHKVYSDISLTRTVTLFDDITANINTTHKYACFTIIQIQMMILFHRARFQCSVVSHS